MVPALSPVLLRYYGTPYRMTFVKRKLKNWLFRIAFNKGLQS